MLALRQGARTASELGLWVAPGRGQAELLAMLHLQPLSCSPLTWTFSALGGTRTPNLLIRRSARPDIRHVPELTDDRHYVP